MVLIPTNEMSDWGSDILKAEKESELVPSIGI
jgi:hypothetical protein